MKRQIIRRGLWAVLAVTMVMTAGGCGALAGQKTSDTASEQNVQDAESLVSSEQESSDISATASKTENFPEPSGSSLEDQEQSETSVLLSAGQMARDISSEAETESANEKAQISVTVEETEDKTAIQVIEGDTLVLPSDMPFCFTFSSGAGGWSTDIFLQSDGTFSGAYHDSDMGTSGADYPNGTVYYCNFSGKLEVVQKMDEYSYALKLASLEKEKGKEYIEDGIRYVPSEPYGMEKGKSYILYLPDTPLDGLSEEFLMWWPGRYDMQEQKRTTLGYYGLYNKDMEYGFFGEVE